MTKAQKRSSRKRMQNRRQSQQAKAWKHRFARPVDPQLNGAAAMGMNSAVIIAALSMVAGRRG